MAAQATAMHHDANDDNDPSVVLTKRLTRIICQHLTAAVADAGLASVDKETKYVQPAAESTTSTDNDKDDDMINLLAAVQPSLLLPQPKLQW